MIFDRFKKRDDFQRLADSMPQIVWMARPSGVIDYFNRRWFDYTATNPNKTPRTLESVLHIDDLKHYRKQWHEAVATVQPFQSEFRFWDYAEERYRWFLARALPIKDELNCIVRWFGTCTDIDEQKHVEEELHRAVRARDEFLSIASHELKTPLTPLKLKIQNLIRTTEKEGVAAIPASQVLACARQVDAQIKRLSALIDDLLDVSRISAGKLSLNLECCDFGAFVREIAERFAEQFRIQGSPFSLEVEPHLNVSFDRLRIEQLLTNLISNAMKHAPGAPLSVRVHQRISGRVRLEVEDRGPGIRKRDQARVFERFERAVCGQNTMGLGLGLYITKQIAEAHQGLVWVESEEGKGSKFIVDLPATQEDRWLNLQKLG